jgi:hypothetical protein
MKYPDTRNKLDTNAGLNKKKKNTRLTMGDLKANVKKAEEKESPLKLKAEKKPSKGSLFKKAFGYSKTMKRNIRKNQLSTVPGGLSAVEQYRELRAKKAKIANKVRQKKHSDSVAYKRANGKKGKGKTQQAIKVPKKK